MSLLWPQLALPLASQILRTENSGPSSPDEARHAITASGRMSSIAIEAACLASGRAPIRTPGGMEASAALRERFLMSPAGSQLSRLVRVPGDHQARGGTVAVRCARRCLRRLPASRSRAAVHPARIRLDRALSADRCGCRRCCPSTPRSTAMWFDAGIAFLSCARHVQLSSESHHGRGQ